MGRFFLIRVIWAFVFWGTLWIAGDRYGVPEAVRATSDIAFSYIEKNIQDLWVNLRDKEPAMINEEELPEGQVIDQKSRPKPSSQVSQNEGLRINEAGLEIIKKSEGSKLKAYQSDGRSYIGYSHQMKPGEPSEITEEEAERLLRQDVRSSEEAVRSRLSQPATDNQFSAMVSLAYNLGAGDFARSSVLAKFNTGDVQGAADAFLSHNKGGGKVSKHLIERREAERALFLMP